MREALVEERERSDAAIQRAVEAAFQKAQDKMDDLIKVIRADLDIPRIIT